MPTASADIVAALETIEHLESPRAFCRELTRILKPGGWLVAEHAESAERAEPPLPDRQGTIRRVPGRLLSDSPHGAPADRSRAHRRRLRAVGDRARLLVRRPDSADRRALSARRCRRCFPRRCPTTWCWSPARMRDPAALLGFGLGVRDPDAAVWPVSAGRTRSPGSRARPSSPACRADLGGSSFVCDLRDTISREVCFTGRYEPQETQLASAPSRSGHGRRRRRRQLGLLHARRARIWWAEPGA